MRPTLVVTGLREQLVAVRTARARLADLTEIHRRVTLPWLRLHMIAQFETDGSHGGSPWAPLEAKYLRLKLARGASPRPLRWKPGREEIKPSLTEEGHPLQVAEVGPDGVRFGSRARHLESVMRGGVNPLTGETFPGRDPFATTDAQRAELAALIEEAIAAEMRSAGLTVREAA